MKNWIRFISFILITAVVLVLVDSFIFTGEMKGSHYSQFFKEEENSLDVIFIGNSTVRNSVIPTEIWAEHKITSYSITNSPTHLEVIYLAIDEIARLQKPKLVVIDITGLTFQTEETQKSYVKEFIGSIPNSSHKEELKAKYDYFDEEVELFENHNDFRNPHYFNIYSKRNEYLKGFTPKYDAGNFEKSKIIVDDDKVLSLSDDGERYLIKILETCSKHENINFLFIRTPRIITEESIKETYMMRSAIGLINEYGYEYVELEKYYDEIGLKSNEDFADYVHMNYYGALKFTKFIIPFLDEKYNIKGNEYSDSVKNNFDNAYRKYEKKIKSKYYKA